MMYRKVTADMSSRIILAAVMVFGGVFGAWAHGVNDSPLDKYQSGQLMAKSERIVKIDGRDYILHPKVVLEDDEGRPKLLQDFKTDTYVRYRLKNDRIHELILVTPK